MSGVSPEDLAESDLIRELEHLHRTRNDTFLHGAPDALREHTSRSAEQEQEYLRRHPERDVDPLNRPTPAHGQLVSRSSVHDIAGTRFPAAACLPQLRESAVGPQEFGEGAAFHDPTDIEHDDLVDRFQAVQPVGDQQE